MRHLNYNHLFYFWTVAREGSIARPSPVLHITPQTISGQLKLLEEAVGEPVFHRVGRGLVLTDTGTMIRSYADDIFARGAELAKRVKHHRLGAPETLTVGIEDSIAKLIASRLLQPALSSGSPCRLICREGEQVKLLSDLAGHRLDVVLSDQPVPNGLNVKAYNHVLGESMVGFFGHPKLLAQLAGPFPACLNDAPMLLPIESTALRRRVDDWLENQGLVPQLVAEFDDSALLKAFGDAGVGVFPAPMAIANEIEHMYQARFLGEVSGITETYYAISPQRKITHNALLTIMDVARAQLLKESA